MKNKKGLIFVLIILMSVGFAAVTTTLIINGTTIVAENEEDYKVVLPKEDIQIINEIRKNPKLVEYLREDPKRRVEYISKIKNI